jgi:hypothetical protein
MQDKDSERMAELAAAPIDDPRASHYWDGRRHLARALGRAMNISASESVPMSGGFGAAWDVYLAYGRGHEDMLRPTFWMHQLGVKHAPRLDVEAWMRKIEEWLAAT